MIFGVWAICHVSTLCICLSDYIAQLRHAVMDMSVDESYQLPTKGNDICLRAAKSVAASLQTPSKETSVFCDWLITNLSKIMDGSANSSGSLNREKLWTEYYQLQISPAFTEKWEGFLQSVSAPTEAIFFQHCTKILFDNMLKDKYPVHHDNQCTNLDLSFTMEEENAICNVGGCVIASLKKQEGNEELLVGLDSFIEKDIHEVAAIPTSAVWVEEVNRGGLTRITEEAHQLGQWKGQ